MKKIILVAMVACFAFGMVACGDDDDSGGPCDDLADMVQDDIDTVCADYPDCSICEPADADGDGASATDEECQDFIDAYDSDAAIAGYEMVCEMEAGE